MANSKTKNSKNKTSISDAQAKSIKEYRHQGFYYSFLTIVLLFCLIQMGCSAIYNISKVISHKAKIATLKKVLNNAEDHNKDLKREIQAYSSAKNLEGIARNNLKMAGEDEILIIINNKQESKNNKNAK